jgi:hypothetical protein
MSELAYLLARLPRLYPDCQQRPVGVAEFLGLIGDQQHRGWCAAVLDWLQIANREARSLQLPLPFPDAGELPTEAEAPMNPWRSYYRRLNRLGSPPLLRRWAREDAAGIVHRANYRGTESTLVRRQTPRTEVATLIETTPATLEEAAEQDRSLLALRFLRLDQFLYGSAADAPDRLYAYAIRLLLLVRLGVPLEVEHAA